MHRPWTTYSTCQHPPLHLRSHEAVLGSRSHLPPYFWRDHSRLGWYPSSPSSYLFLSFLLARKMILDSHVKILIESTIQDPIARTFWRTHFYSAKKGLQEEVPWGEFLLRLSQSADIDITRETQQKLCLLIATHNTSSQTDILITFSTLIFLHLSLVP